MLRTVKIGASEFLVIKMVRTKPSGEVSRIDFTFRHMPEHDDTEDAAAIAHFIFTPLSINGKLYYREEKSVFTVNNCRYGSNSLFSTNEDYVQTLNIFMHHIISDLDGAVVGRRPELLSGKLLDCYKQDQYYLTKASQFRHEAFWVHCKTGETERLWGGSDWNCSRQQHDAMWLIAYGQYSSVPSCQTA